MLLLYVAKNSFLIHKFMPSELKETDFSKKHLLDDLISEVSDVSLMLADEDIYNIQKIDVMMGALKEEKVFRTENENLQKLYDRLQKLIRDGVEFEELKKFVDEAVSIAKELISEDLIKLQSSGINGSIKVIVDGVALPDCAAIAIGPKSTPLSLDYTNALGRHIDFRSWRPPVILEQGKPFNEIDVILNPVAAVPKNSGVSPLVFPDGWIEPDPTSQVTGLEMDQILNPFGAIALQKYDK